MKWKVGDYVRFNAATGRIGRIVSIDASRETVAWSRPYEVEWIGVETNSSHYRYCASNLLPATEEDYIYEVLCQS